MLRLPPPLSSLLHRLSSPPLTRAVSSASRTPTDARAACRSKMLGRPPTEKLSLLDWKKNSCSFIGTVLRPVKQNPSGGAYTVIEVNPSGKYLSYPFRILLDMRDKIAEISIQYLKPDDFVYVLGCLKSSEKVYENGDTQVCYKVFVTVLNYVQRINQNIPSKQHDDLRIEERTVPTSAALDQQRASTSSEPDHEMDRLHLWGVYFANPCEWWDNRKSKKYPGAPDFKHKDMGECLWIRPDDPPWIQKQLQLNDSNLVTGYQRRRPSLKNEWEV